MHTIFQSRRLCAQESCVETLVYPSARWGVIRLCSRKGGHTLVTLPRTVTPYRDTMDGTRDRVTYQKLVTR